MRVYLKRVARVNFFRSQTQTYSAIRVVLDCGARESRFGFRSSYFCFTAIAEISTRALFTKAAAWMVARAGLGSGMTLL